MITISRSHFNIIVDNDVFVILELSASGNSLVMVKNIEVANIKSKKIYFAESGNSLYIVDGEVCYITPAFNVDKDIMLCKALQESDDVKTIIEMCEL